MLFSNPKPGGFLERAQNWMTPERAIAMQGLGQGISQLASGQPVNMSPAMTALAQRQQRAQARQMLEESGIMGRFTPDQRAMLAQMEPGAAQKIIASTLFASGSTPTDDMREYQLAQSQGFNGTFTDYMTQMRRAGATSITNNLGNTGIDYGTPPADMAWARNPDGTVQVDERGAPVAVVIRGSDTDRKQIESLTESANEALVRSETEAAGAENETRKNSVVLEDIGRAREKIEGAPWYDPAAGFAGNILKNVGGTSAADTLALTDTIRANIGFDRLQAMREASPTGGALGNVTERELGQLQAVLGSLEQSQSENQLLENLDRLDGIYRDIMTKVSAYPNAAEFGFDVSVASESGSVPQDVDPDLWELLTPEEKALWDE